MSFTLARYIAWRLIASVGGLFIAFTALIMIIDLIENMRFAGKYANGSLLFALKITALRALSLSQVLSPFLFLFGALWCFQQLNKRSEISVMRSAGLSVWRVLAPTALTALFTGILLITVVDPVSTRMLAHSEKMKNDIRGKRTSVVKFLNDGIWLRQTLDEGALLINARSINEKDGILGAVTVFEVDAKGALSERIDAPEGYLEDSKLDMRYAKVRLPGDPLTKSHDSYKIPINLSAQDLSEQVAAPETISLWNLNRFIRLAQATGLSTRAYYLRYHDLLSTPLKLLGMVLIAAGFSMRPSRMGGALILVVFSIATGFILYIITEIATALGEAGSVPLVVAAWSPAIIATLLAITGLLHLEDG